MIDTKRFKGSLKYAWTGLRENHRREQNFRIQVAVGLFVVVFAFILHLDWLRVTILLMTIATVLSMEMMNSGLERYIDQLTPQRDQRIGQVKDTLAGAVLIVAIFAVMIGAAIFYQPIISLFF